MTGTVNRRVKTCPRPQSTLTVWSTRGIRTVIALLE
uniref:Uncharacterized protein n=1 Tax=Anguilla anguilla TaxID=7936 RepID=A0A0E9PLD0_ANGAN